MDALREFAFYYLFDPEKVETGVEDLPVEVQKELEFLAHKMQQPYSGLEIRDRTYHMKVYKGCFLGSDAVTFVANFLKIERDVATKVGNLLLKKKLFQHVANDHEFKDKILSKKVIVGGGYAGSIVAKQLQEQFDVTLIDKKPSFESILSFPQLAADPSSLDKISVPHKKYLGKATVLYDSVVDVVPAEEYCANEDDLVKRSFVKLQSGEKLPYDYLVLATGSTFLCPFKTEGTNMIVNPYSSESIVGSYSTLQAAKTVAVIGGGPVGVEFAGEIAAKFPDVKVVVVSQRTLLERLAPAAHKNAFQALSKYPNVKFMLGKRVSHIKDNTVHLLNMADVDQDTEWQGDENYKTIKNEDDIPADVIYLAVGFMPNTEFLKSSHLQHSLNQYGFVQINDQFQVAKTESKTHFYNNVFALGDITDLAEEKLAQAAEKHAEACVEIIKQTDASASKDKFTKYKIPTSRIMLISMGPNRALMISGKKVVFDNAFISKIKAVTEMIAVRKA